MEKKELNNNNNIIEKRENRFNNRVSNHELLKVVKAMEGFPIKLSNPVSLPDLVNFYYRFWNNDLTDSEESDDSSS
jgi:hypothetical protein